MTTSLLFSDASTGLWSYDEGTGTTTQIASYKLGNVGIELAIGSEVFISAQPAGGQALAQNSLWVSDGTAGGSHLVVTLPDKSPSPSIIDNPLVGAMVALPSGQLLFDYYDGTSGDHLYTSDGTSAGTKPVPGYTGAGIYIGPGYSVFLNGKLIFADYQGGLSSYDPATNSVTTLSTNFGGNNGSGEVRVGDHVFIVGHSLSFSQLPWASTQLWTTDGTAPGTSLVTTLPDHTPVGQFDSAGLYGLTALANGTLAFRYFDGVTNYAYISDGTAAGTVAMPGYTGSGAFFGVDHSVELNGALLFTDSTTGLWSYNETSGTTTQLATFALGSNGGEMALANGHAFFAARAAAGNVVSETALWITDGTAAGTSLVTTLPDTTPTAQFDSAGISGLVAMANGKVAFAYSDGTNQHVYVSDGTTAGTQPIPGYNGTAPYLGTMVSTELSVACFASGTTIETDHGPRAVEHLRAGDCVRSAFGGFVPVTWIGRRTLDCRRHPRPHDVHPIRVHAHAFGPGRPSRDLRLSPDHAVHVDGLLIPIRYLINGATILQEPVDRITYWHVELPAHDILFADGLPCESYLDTGNRGAFSNAPGAIMLDPDFARNIWDTGACAPLVIDGPQLARAHAQCLAIATTAGHAITADPALRILIDDRPATARIVGQSWHVALPPGCRAIRLLSRVWVPGHMCPDSNDTRRLGVALTEIRMDGVPVSSASFGPGWHTAEPSLHWTDGNACLNPAGARNLTFTLALAGNYWTVRDPTPALRAV